MPALRCGGVARCGVACVRHRLPVTHRHRLGYVALSDALSGHLSFFYRWLRVGPNDASVMTPFPLDHRSVGRYLTLNC
jgi:hypothetical protein